MPPAAISRPPRDWKQSVKRFLIGLLITPIIFFFVFLWITLNWSYSDGDRSGYLQKFSRRGWICKTYEGELAMSTVPGTAPVIWEFSVGDKEVAEKIAGLLGKKVILHYREYPYIPTDCFGATDYFVDAVTVAE
jgi:hypothetical protein